MHLTCPVCHATSAVEAFCEQGPAHEALLLAAALPGDLAPLVLRYLGLFRQGIRGLTWARTTRLLREVGALLAAPELVYDGRTYPIALSDWMQGLRAMLDAKAPPAGLANHNYLKQCVLTALRRREGRAEAAHEAHRQAGRREDAARPPERTNLRELLSEGALDDTQRAYLRKAGLLRNLEDPTSAEEEEDA